MGGVGMFQRNAGKSHFRQPRQPWHADHHGDRHGHQRHYRHQRRHFTTWPVCHRAFATPTGFSVVFDEPFNPSLISLYNYGASGGPDDVLLDSASGPQLSYRGSLVIDPSDRTITFVKTSTFTSVNFSPSTGVLAAGTYTVTLRTASNGFQDQAGHFLDGLDEGDTGFNYVATFVVTGTPAVVGVPAFARGPSNVVESPMPWAAPTR